MRVGVDSSRNVARTVKRLTGYGQRALETIFKAGVTRPEPLWGRVTFGECLTNGLRTHSFYSLLGIELHQKGRGRDASGDLNTFINVTDQGASGTAAGCSEVSVRITPTQGRIPHEPICHSIWQVLELEKKWRRRRSNSRPHASRDAKRALYQLSYVPDKGGADSINSTLSTSDRTF